MITEKMNEKLNEALENDSFIEDAISTAKALAAEAIEASIHEVLTDVLVELPYSAEISKDFDLDDTARRAAEHYAGELKLVAYRVFSATANYWGVTDIDNELADFNYSAISDVITAFESKF